MADLQEILVSLPRLSKQDLEQLRGRISFLLGSSAPSADTALGDPDCELVLDAILAIIRSAGGGSVPVVMLKRSSQYREFKKKVPVVLDAFRRQKDMSAVKLRALVRVSMQLLQQDLQQIGIAVTARTLMSHVHRLPAVLDKNFPGYLHAGLISVVVRSR